ncbi:MAG TPA: SCO family protein [Candidatus Binatia bacterium]
MAARRGWVYLTLTLALWLSVAPFVHAHDASRPIPLRDVEFDQKLDSQIPLDLSFTDERGASVKLRDYLRGKPIILNFVYYKCRDLCPLLLDGMVRTLRTLSFDVGNEFDVLTVSFDPDDTAALALAKKKDVVSSYRRPDAERGWHFLTGEEAAIHKLTEAVGFHYSFDAGTGEFAHATGLVLLTPEGKTSRYFYGIEFSPRDLRLGLVEAAGGKIGTPIDQLLLFCYHYDPVSGKYGALITNMIRLAGLMTAVALGGFILWMLRRERANSGSTGRTA